MGISASGQVARRGGGRYIGNRLGPDTSGSLANEGHAGNLAPGNDGRVAGVVARYRCLTTICVA
jgi:hypothetical protein